jgi:branched-chain amino acid transport system substrate-binding protein
MTTVALACRFLVILQIVISPIPSWAQKYDVGVTDTEIKIGNTVPYSGPASSYGTVARATAAYFKKINEEGGVNGRKINFISYDDANSPPKTVEQTRKLVESDEVALILGAIGTAPNTAVQKYLNAKRVPQLFVGTGATKWGDPEHFPWTMGWQPTYQSEGRVFAKSILTNYPRSKIAVLYQNEDFGKDYLKGLKDGLGDKATSMIVAEKTYERTDPTVDSQVVTLKASGADIMVTFAIPKMASQTIRKMAEVGWKPVHYLSSISSSVASAIKPAGLENAQGLISLAYTKDPTDPVWKDDPATKEWVAFMDRYYPDGDKADSLNVVGYLVAQTMIQVLKQAGDDLTRSNIMKQAASLKGVELGMLLPGITLETGPADYFPLEQLQSMRFEGSSWYLFGDIIRGDIKDGQSK